MQTIESKVISKHLSCNTMNSLKLMSTFNSILKDKDIALESMDYLDELSSDDSDTEIKHNLPKQKQKQTQNCLSSILVVTSRSNESLENQFSEILLNML